MSAIQTVQANHNHSYDNFGNGLGSVEPCRTPDTCPQTATVEERRIRKAHAISVDYRTCRRTDGEHAEHGFEQDAACQADATEAGTVKAKDAPLGVQLWPTVSPEYAPNFTLDTVTRQLGSNGREYVIWQYQNGNTRMFLADEDVAVQIVSGAE